jgi:AbrB family looped-hinge helix DNA binding protein
MELQYPVKLDRKGHVLIPAEVRRTLGIGPMSLLLMKVKDGDLRLSPGEMVSKRRIREISREELAQGLMDGAVSPQGIKAAKVDVRELGLDPANFPSQL